MTARFSGRQGKGAARRLQEIKRAEANERAALPIAPGNRKAARLGTVKAIIHKGGRTIAVRGALPIDAGWDE